MKDLDRLRAIQRADALQFSRDLRYLAMVAEPQMFGYDNWPVMPPPLEPRHTRGLIIPACIAAGYALLALTYLVMRV